MDPSLIESKREQIQANQYEIDNVLIVQRHQYDQYIEGYKRNINEYSRKIENNNNNINIQNEQISKLKNDINDLNSKKKEYERMNNTINQYIIPKLKSANTQYKDGANQLQKYYSSTEAKKKVIELDDQNKNIENIMIELRDKILGASNDKIRSINSLISNKNTNIEDLERQIRNKYEENHQYEEHIKSSNNQIDVCYSKKADIQQKINYLINENERLQAEINSII